MAGRGASSSKRKKFSSDESSGGAFASPRTRRSKVKKCSCGCPNAITSEPGPIYSQLGTGRSIDELRAVFEERGGISGQALRIKQLIYTGEKTSKRSDCPVAREQISRSSPHEKVLVLAKERRGHQCSATWIVVAIVVWEAVSAEYGSQLYQTIPAILRQRKPDSRGCGSNQAKSCTCQGTGPESGASFSFGCSFQTWHVACKFARSQEPRKFRLEKIAQAEELTLGATLEGLATSIAPLFRKMVPDAYANMTKNEQQASDCRLGSLPGRPWAGVTVCSDFAAHYHYDVYNMENGCTAVLTLTSPTKVERQQLHVLANYVLASDEPSSSGENSAKTQEKGQTTNAEHGGVGISLCHGSIAFEYAKVELHGTSSVPYPNREKPSRLSIIYYQHRGLDKPRHSSVSYASMRAAKIAEAAEVTELPSEVSAAIVTNPVPNEVYAHNFRRVIS